MVKQSSKNHKNRQKWGPIQIIMLAVYAQIKKSYK